MNIASVVEDTDRPSRQMLLDIVDIPLGGESEVV
jgi:hypothetical protein